MDHDFEMQPHGAPGPRNSSRSHPLGRPTCPSKLPGGVSPLIPVLRKTFHLDAFSPSHIPQASSRPGLGARAWSVSSQETGKSLASRKFSSISLTVHPHSQARPLGPLPSHWEELSSPGREAATHGGGRLPTVGLSSVTLVPGDRVHSEGPGNPGLAKSSRMPTAEKPLVSSYLTLPFQSRLAPSPPGSAGPGSVGPRHPVPVTAHVPARASPGRGKPRSRGIPRPRLHLQRASPTTGPEMAMDLAALDTRPRTASRLSTRTTNKPGLTVNLATPNPSRLDTGIESLDLDTNLGSAVDVAIVGTSKPGRGMDSVTPDPDKVGKAIATEGRAKPEFTTAGAVMERAAPDPVKLGTARPDTVMLVNTAKLGVTTNSPALDTSRLVIAMGPAVPVTPDPAAGESTLDSVINLTTSDVATQPSMLSQSTDAALSHPAADAATDWATELDRARETKGKCKELGWRGTGLLRVGGQGCKSLEIDYAWLDLEREGRFFFKVRMPFTLISMHLVYLSGCAGSYLWHMQHVGSYFPDQGANPRPLHRKVDSEPLDHQGSPGREDFKVRVE